MPFLDADYAAIEARIVNWLAGQEDALQEYRDGVDRYKSMASMIYRVPTENVNKHPQRFVGKQAVLGCIAEGELVLTNYGLVPIEKVCAWHRLWDGVEWVQHEGLIYQGQKEVITYDGLTATPDHVVFTGVGFEGTTDLRSAWQQKLRLTVSAEKGTPIWTMDAFDQQGLSFSKELSLHESPLRLWDCGDARFADSMQKTERWLRCLFAKRQEIFACSQMASCAHGSGKKSVSESSQSGVQMVWSEGRSVSFQVPHSRSQLGNGQFGIEETFDVGPTRQQRPLRAGEHALCHNAPATTQYQYPQAGLRRSEVALLSFCGLALPPHGIQPFSNSETGGTSSSREAQRLATNPKTVATFDILNAGPRNRFTVSGKLVHNCGFGMGPPKFRVTCWKMGRYDLPQGLEETAVKAFRAKHKKVVSCWYELERAAKQAILRKGEVFKVLHLSFKFRDVEGMPFLLMRLPSGRKLAYPRARISSDRITFFGNVKGVTWGDVNTWGGTLLENATQAVAADIMTNGVHQTERAGYETATLIHDQALAYHREGQTPEEFVRLLTTLPAWAKGLPIEAEGALVRFYKKD